jgi:hypothetical protein
LNTKPTLVWLPYFFRGPWKRIPKDTAEAQSTPILSVGYIKHQSKNTLKLSRKKNLKIKE